MRELFEHQKKAVQFIRSRNRGALYLDAGLGKTISIIRGLELSEFSERRSLIICPASVIPTFIKELKMEGIKNYDIHSYEILVKSFKNNSGQEFKRISKQYSFLIVDESHYIRNWSAQRTKAVIELSKYISKVWFLSGTPTITRSLDLHPTLSIIEPGKWGKVKEFGKRYCYVKYNPFKRQKEFEGYKNWEPLNKKIQHCTLRQEKQTELANLPDKIEGIHWVTHDDYTNDEYINYNNDKWGRKLREQRNSEHIATVRKDAAMAKIPQYIDSLKARNITRGILFCWHKDIAESLVSKMITDKLSKTPMIISGDVSQKRRERYIRSFKQGTLDWLIITIGAGGLGINLQETNYVGFVELPFTHAELNQAYSRVWRIGNKGVNIEYVLLENSIDEPIYKICMDRGASAAKLFDPKETIHDVKWKPVEVYPYGKPVKTIRKPIPKELLDSG